MKKKMLCLSLVMISMFSLTANAAENSKMFDAPVSEYPAEHESIVAQEMQVPEGEIAELEQEIAKSNRYASARAADSANYEPNDTINMAFPYERTDKIEHRDNEPNGHYGCNYVYSSLETPDDLDFFEITLRPGIMYAVVLKNIWLSQERDIRIYYQKPDGSWWYRFTDERKERQTIFHFRADTTTYYIRISGEPATGYKHDASHNWFAVARDGTIDERPLVGSVKPSCSLQ